MWGSYGFLVSDWMEDKVDGIFLGRVEKSALRIKAKATAILNDPASTPQAKKQARARLNQVNKVIDEQDMRMLRKRIKVRLGDEDEAK